MKNQQPFNHHSSIITHQSLLTCLLLALLALHTTIFLRTTLAYIRFPYEQKSVVEGITLYNALQYTQGRQPYHDPTETPFTSMVYPPVHEIALAGIITLLGGPTLAGARLFSLLCALGAALVAGLAVKRHTRNWLITLLGGGFLICGYGLTQQWLEQIRNDALLVFLIILGLHLAQRAIQQKRFPAASLIILVLALYTKQTALFAAVAVIITLLFSNRRRALLWAALYLAAAVCIFILMQIWSNGWFAFYLIKVPANVGIRSQQLIFGFHLLLFTLPAFTAALHYSLARIRNLRQTPASSLWPLAFILALPTCLLQSIKWGGAMNAFLPLFPLIGILAALALNRLIAAKTPRPKLLTAALALAVLQIGCLLYFPLLPSPAHRASHQRISQWVQAAPGDVLVSGYSSHTYLNGKKYFGDPVIMGDLEQAGLWKGNALIEKIRRGQLALLILRPQIEPADLKAAVSQKYILAEKIHFPRTPPIGGWPYMQAFVPKTAPWKPAK